MECNKTSFFDEGRYLECNKRVAVFSRSKHSYDDLFQRLLMPCLRLH